MSQQIENINKLELCVLPTQIGKTFTTISKIRGCLEQDDEYGQSLHVVFTMNTHLNNAQFAKRLNEIKNIYGKESVCVFSSKKNSSFVHVKSRFEAQGLCNDIDNCPKVIIMCSNSKRYTDGVDFLKNIETSVTHIKRTYVYYDELHEYINGKVRAQIEEINDLEKVNCITALTASPDNIFDKNGYGYWSKIRLIELEDFNDANYVGHQDMVFNCIDDFFEIPYNKPHPMDYDILDAQTIGFIEHVLDRHPEILADNSRSFIPAHIRCKGHEEVRELIFNTKSNAVVVLLNGNEKSLQYKDEHMNTKTLSLISGYDEVCETIARQIVLHKLQSRPLVITGYRCIGMGQTLTHSSLGSFTSAIISHMNISCDAVYQLFGRLTGRMKDWGDKYFQTQVYCPSIIMNRCGLMEICARNMVENHNGECVTKETYFEPVATHALGTCVTENFRKPKRTKTKLNHISGEVRQKCSTPVVIIKISDEQKEKIKNAKTQRKRTFVNNFMKDHDKELYTLYKSYKHKVWYVNPETTEYEKWGISNLLKEGAMSAPVNITTKEITSNILMIYIYQNILILNAWNGEANNT